MKPTGAQSMMNTKEVAAFLGVHVNTVARLVSLYKLPQIRLAPRCVRFQKSDVDGWVRSRRVANVSDHGRVLKGA